MLACCACWDGDADGGGGAGSGGVAVGRRRREVGALSCLNSQSSNLSHEALKCHTQKRVLRRTKRTWKEARRAKQGWARARAARRPARGRCGGARAAESQRRGEFPRFVLVESTKTSR